MKAGHSDDQQGPPAAPPPPADGVRPDEANETSLPGLHTWRAVYCFVLGSFALWVALLIWLTRAFS
jgi:hypothetical protein